MVVKMRSISVGCMKKCVALFLLMVVVQWCGLSVAILDPMDFLALQSLRKGLEDLPGSNYFSSWDFTADPCNFAGVFCAGDKVAVLNLGDPRAGSPGLTGRLDPAIGKLSALVEFTIVPGRVFGSLPATLSQCSNLRFLGISRNYITGQIPASLGQLRRLRTLDLSFNQFTGAIPRSVGTVPVLSNVVLCHNRLTGPVPPFVSQTLTRFDVKHNDLTGSLSHFTLPPSLQYLSLSTNRLTGQVDGLLNRMDRLNYIDLSMNQFTGSIPGKLFSLPLTNIQLQRNAFSGPIHPLDSVTITTVDLSYNRLSGSISPMFAWVQNLYLNNNRFTGNVPATFVDRLLSSNIQILYLQHNYLVGMDINPAAEIPSSTSLCLQYNCMVPVVDTPCPLKSGKQRTRPASQCGGDWKGKS